MDKIKPTREDILATINKIIEEDYDDTYYPYEPINESNLLTDSEMDSFAYAIFWLSVSTKYKIIPDYSNSLEKEKGMDIAFGAVPVCQYCRLCRGDPAQVEL